MIQFYAKLLNIGFPPGPASIDLTLAVADVDGGLVTVLVAALAESELIVTFETPDDVVERLLRETAATQTTTQKKRPIKKKES